MLLLEFKVYQLKICLRFHKLTHRRQSMQPAKSMGAQGHCHCHCHQERDYRWQKITVVLFHQLMLIKLKTKVVLSFLKTQTHNIKQTNFFLFFQQRSQSYNKTNIYLQKNSISAMNNSKLYQGQINFFCLWFAYYKPNRTW